MPVSPPGNPQFAEIAQIAQIAKIAEHPVVRRVQRLSQPGAPWHGMHLQVREAGDVRAPWLVLLHPSPRSSVMYEPWMHTLAPHFHVLAIDTPGYGGSSPLPQPPRSLADYTAPLHALLQGLQQQMHQELQSDPTAPGFLLYGSATGAQLGIAYARAYPQQVRHLLLDNAAHFDDGERARILAHYFPDLSPRDDGSHLQAVWRMAAQMLQFFPWFETDEAHRVSQHISQHISPRTPTAAEVHATAMEILAAGPGYALAYRAAFEHERAEHVQALTVPTTLLRWEGSVLLRHIDRLLTFPLPPQVQVLQTPADFQSRYAAMTQHLLTLR